MGVNNLSTGKACCNIMLSGGVDIVVVSNEGDMPVISAFYGVIILMFFFDNRKHNRPHIHAQSGEFEAVISIDDGEVLEGELPKSRMRLVQAWIEIHKDELITDWQLAVNGQQPAKIEPLK